MTNEPDKKTVLVVEDDSLSRFMISEMCEKLGYECDAVSDGQECLDVLSQTPDRFAVVLMDIHMPKVTGLEASATIRESRKHSLRDLPIVAMTADAHWHNPHRCKAQGFNSVISKPVTMMRLTETLEAFMG